MITSKKIKKEMMKKKNSKYLGILLILFLLFSAYEIYNGYTTPKDQVTLISCIDGDTAHFNLGGEDKKVRFLAIDAPEIAKGNTPADPFGEEASVYACDILKGAQEIKLEYEETKEDKYGRTLAWVWVDGVLLQEKLVREGLAEVKYLYDDYKYTDVVQIGEKAAKEQNKGIWSIK
ncbi:MAG: thermonuclease family protein [Anaerorhabdus sp.]|uniref:thermonuclease family protein n=1 Tax=Anaerorhabdus sp. TaxID=1872524 RepID=UPI002FC5C36A